MEKKHIIRIPNGEKLMLNLNYNVTRAQFYNDAEPEHIVEATCVVKPDGSKAFVTDDGKEHSPKDFQYDYKGYFYKNENDVVLWIYNEEPHGKKGGQL